MLDNGQKNIIKRVNIEPFFKTDACKKKERNNTMRRGLI